MKINDLISILEKKLNKNLKIQSLKIEDKSFLHKNHKSNQIDKFHIKLTIACRELKLLRLIDANRKINMILEEELNKFIHSIQIKLL